MALRRLERVFCQQLLQSAVRCQSVRAGSSVAHLDPYYKIGKREVVGYGHNGGFNYMDRPDFPMPAVRFREANNEILNRSHYRKTTYHRYFTVLPPLPASFTPENQAIQLRNMIELQVDPIDGLASKYDYEKNQWKK
ncbi:cytochrome c oxidase subunit 4 isoform 1, mitochondrial [Hyalella azteca]|uniref:Cytochrome c oxidase subunit 4 isoform 1, mitochondrial n=1 Tax=Hyalella azteca TaxID=294128 RepID=A0A8B7NI31_HYAAZ|nr:cytochrome c oxidase subunit 4 isoform 1, mitochondrial [Hyalella azteca]